MDGRRQKRQEYTSRVSCYHTVLGHHLLLIYCCQHCRVGTQWAKCSLCNCSEFIITLLLSYPTLCYIFWSQFKCYPISSIGHGVNRILFLSTDNSSSVPKYKVHHYCYNFDCLYLFSASFIICKANSVSTIKYIHKRHVYWFVQV